MQLGGGSSGARRRGGYGKQCFLRRGRPRCPARWIVAEASVPHLQILDDALLLPIELRSQKQNKQMPGPENEIQHQGGQFFPYEDACDARTLKPSQPRPTTCALNSNQLTRMIYDVD